MELVKIKKNPMSSSVFRGARVHLFKKNAHVGEFMISLSII